MLYIIFYFWDYILFIQISTAEDPTGNSKYGPRSFLAYVADNPYHLYATG